MIFNVWRLHRIHNEPNDTKWINSFDTLKINTNIRLSLRSKTDEKNRLTTSKQIKHKFSFIGEPVRMERFKCQKMAATFDLHCGWHPPNHRAQTVTTLSKYLRDIYNSYVCRARLLVHSSRGSLKFYSNQNSLIKSTVSSKIQNRMSLTYRVIWFRRRR